MTGRPGPGSSAVLRAPGLEVVLDDEGTVVSVGSADRATAWLGRSARLEVATAGGPLVLGPPRVTVDVDEVETERSGGGLRTLVRHSVEQGWTVRVVLANDSDAPLVLDEVRLVWRAAPGTVVSALAAGAQAAYAVQPVAGAGPVLVGRLRSGAQPGVSEDGLLLGPLVLAPGHRWAAGWRWEVAADARRASAADLPRTTWLDLGQTVVLPGSLDAAVVAPGLAVELEDDRVEVGAPGPGEAVVELRSARGTTAHTLTWAPDLDDLVDARLAVLLGGPTTPAGTLRLPDADAGLVVQDALAARTSAAVPDDLDDALELLAGDLVEQLDDGVALEPVALAFLAREADRGAPAAVLDGALRGVLATRSATPGTGLAGMALALALVRAGRATADLVTRLTTLGDDLELALLLRPREGVAGTSVLADLRRLGAAVGAGLPGRVVPAPPVSTVAYASALLALVDEPTGQRLLEGWGVAASELARRTAAEARARVTVRGGGAEDRRALSWLLLGRR